MSKSVLLISYFFPPWPGAGALRPGRLAKLLPEFGWTPTTLVGSSDGAGFEYGEVVHITPFGDPIAPRIPGLWRAVSGPGRWFPGALRAALSLTSRRRFDAVMSVYNPAFTHMLAASVAHRSRLPWLADYSETWNGNAFTAPKLALARGYNRAIELHAVRGAAAITAATASIRNGLAKLHERDDIEVVENSIDEAEWDRIPDVSPPAFTFLYAGGLYGGLLTPDALFSAIAKLRRAGHPAGLAARFEFYCHNEHRIVMKAASRWGMENVVRCYPATLREVVLHAERRAAVLVALFPMRPISVVPSKLYEYAGARRPILAVGPAQSRELLGGAIEGNRLGYFVTSENECANAVCALHERFTNGAYRTNPSVDWSPPTALKMTRQFASVLDRITGSPRTVAARGRSLAEKA